MKVADLGVCLFLNQLLNGLRWNRVLYFSLNEWRLDETDERGALFTFLHNTVHLQVKLQTPAGEFIIALQLLQIVFVVTFKRYPKIIFPIRKGMDD